MTSNCSFNIKSSIDQFGYNGEGWHFPFQFPTGQYNRPTFAESGVVGAFAGDSSDDQQQPDRFRKLRFRDHIWRYKQKFEESEPAEEAVEEDGGGGGDGMRVVQLLISCAEAVACHDRTQAAALLSDLEANATALGTPFQRVASCFVRGLSDRLAFVQPLGAIGGAAESAAADSGERAAAALAYEICPYLRFGHFVANAAILEAFEGESFVHVVDLGMNLGHQWRDLIRRLAARGGAPPRRVRITGVGPGAEAIGADLESYARSLGMRFEFSGVSGGLENLRRGDFRLDDGEVVAVSSVLQLHRAVKESRGALNSVLQVIRQLSPRVVVVVEQDAGHNGPFFIGRFMEALHYYSAIFDSLEAARLRCDTKRAKVEQFYYGAEIANIVGCEGAARVERHERVEQWRRRMGRAGFQPAPIKTVGQAKQWLEKVKAGEGYTVEEEKGCLLLGWNSKPIIAASCWKC